MINVAILAKNAIFTIFSQKIEFSQFYYLFCAKKSFRKDRFKTSHKFTLIYLQYCVKIMSWNQFVLKSNIFLNSTNLISKNKFFQHSDDETALMYGRNAAQLVIYIDIGHLYFCAQSTKYALHCAQYAAHKLPSLEPRW